MNPDAPRTPREELEIKITALLMGQLPPEEAVEVQRQIDAEPELVALQDRLRRAVELLREARALPDAPPPAVPLKLSNERREKLLAAFRETNGLPKPPPLSKPPRTKAPVPPLDPALVANPSKKRKFPFVLVTSIAALLAVGASLLMPASSRFMEKNRASSFELDPGFASEDGRIAKLESFSADFATEAPPAGTPTPAPQGEHSLLSVTPNSSSFAFAPSSNSQSQTRQTPSAPAKPTSRPETQKPVDTPAKGISGGLAGLPGTMKGRTGGGPSAGRQLEESKSKRTASNGVYLPATPSPATPAESAQRSLEPAPKLPSIDVASTMRGNTWHSDQSSPASESALAAGFADFDRGASRHSESETTRQPDDKNAAPADALASARIITNAQESTKYYFAAGAAAKRETAADRIDARGYAKHDADGSKESTPEDRFGTVPLPSQPGSGPVGSTPVTAGNRSGSLAISGKTVDGLLFSDQNEVTAGAKTAGTQPTGKDNLRETTLGLALQTEGERLARVSDEKAGRGVNADVNGRDKATADTSSAARSQASYDTQALWERPYRRQSGAEADAKAEPKPAQAAQAAQGLADLDSDGLQKKGAKLGQTNTWTGTANLSDGAIEGVKADHFWALQNPQGGPAKDGKPDGGIAINGPIPAPARPEFEGTIHYGRPITGGDVVTTTRGEIPNQGGRMNEFEQPQIPQTFSTGGVGGAVFPTTPVVPANAPIIPDPQSTVEKLETAKADAAAELTLKKSGTGRQTLGIEPAQENFANSFFSLRDAEAKAAEGKTGEALETYRKAAKRLAEIKEQSPNWQPELLEYRRKRTEEAIQELEKNLDFIEPNVSEEMLAQGNLAGLPIASTTQPAPALDDLAKLTDAPGDREVKRAMTVKPAEPAAAEPPSPPKGPQPPPIPQPEVSTTENAFSTFSLNVSDVSFQLAKSSLETRQMPDPASIRSEEFINAFDYRDPAPAPGAPLAFASERARYPFAHNRDLLRISVKTAAAGREPGKPLNLVLLLDNSGSMERSDRVRIVREALSVLTKQLQPQDKVSVITFAREPRLWADGVAGDKASEFTDRIGIITPEGGTNLSAAINLGYKTALKHYSAGTVSRVILLTDGAANLGEVNASALKDKVESYRKQGVAFDCFGVGWEGYNDDLLEQLTRNGDGRYGFINSPEAAATNFAGQLAGALRVAASDVKVQVEFNPKRVTSYRQIGYAKHQLKKEQFRDNTVDAAEIGAAESGNALYAIEVNPRGEGDIATARARYKVPGTSEYHEHEWIIPYQAPAPAMEQASSSLRLAATASAFSEWLAQSPFAADVTTDRLLGLIQGIPAIYGVDLRPAQLAAMIQQAKSISGR